jgi:hypothetical protein
MFELAEKQYLESRDEKIKAQLHKFDSQDQSIIAQLHIMAVVINMNLA